MRDDSLGHTLARLFGHVTFHGLVAGIVLIAALVNWLAPKKVHRLRRTVILFGLYLSACTAAAMFEVTGSPAAVHACETAAEMLAAFTAVNLGELAVFEVMLPRIGVKVAPFATDLLVGVGYVVAVVLCLMRAGLNPSSILGASAVASAVIAISLQSTLGNILGGVAIQLDGSIEVDDWIQLENGRQGRVREIRWRYTAIETRDWDTLIVPNSVILAQSFTILGRRHGQPVQHRMWVFFNVDFRYAPNHVIDVVNEALQSSPIPNVATDPKPNVVCMDMAKDNRDSFAYYGARYWLTDLAVDDPTSSIVRARVHAALRRAGIPLARPSTTQFVGANEEMDDKGRMLRHKRARLAAIDSVTLFASLTAEERESVAERLQHAPFAAGETITRQGAVAHWLYLVNSGRVEIRRHVEEKTVVIGVVVAPGVVGEMGLMAGAPRLADVVACTDVECFRLDKEGFARILHDRPDAAKQFSEVLAKRQIELWEADEKLDSNAMSARQTLEQEAILRRIEGFFGLRRS